MQELLTNLLQEFKKTFPKWDHAILAQIDPPKNPPPFVLPVSKEYFHSPSPSEEKHPFGDWAKQAVWEVALFLQADLRRPLPKFLSYRADVLEEHGPSKLMRLGALQKYLLDEKSCPRILDQDTFLLAEMLQKCQVSLSEAFKQKESPEIVKLSGLLESIKKVKPEEIETSTQTLFTNLGNRINAYSILQALSERYTTIESEITAQVALAREITPLLQIPIEDSATLEGLLSRLQNAIGTLEKALKSSSAFQEELAEKIKQLDLLTCDPQHKKARTQPLPIIHEMQLDISEKNASLAIIDSRLSLTKDAVGILEWLKKLDADITTAKIAILQLEGPYQLKHTQDGMPLTFTAKEKEIPFKELSHPEQAALFTQLKNCQERVINSDKHLDATFSTQQNKKLKDLFATYLDDHLKTPYEKWSSGTKQWLSAMIKECETQLEQHKSSEIVRDEQVSETKAEPLQQISALKSTSSESLAASNLLSLDANTLPPLTTPLNLPISTDLTIITTTSTVSSSADTTLQSREDAPNSLKAETNIIPTSPSSPELDFQFIPLDTEDPTLAANSSLSEEDLHAHHELLALATVERSLAALVGTDSHDPVDRNQNTIETSFSPQDGQVSEAKTVAMPVDMPVEPPQNLEARTSTLSAPVFPNIEVDGLHISQQSVESSPTTIQIAPSLDAGQSVNDTLQINSETTGAAGTETHEPIRLNPQGSEQEEQKTSAADATQKLDDAENSANERQILPTEILNLQATPPSTFHQSPISERSALLLIASQNSAIVDTVSTSMFFSGTLDNENATAKPKARIDEGLQTGENSFVGPTVLGEEFVVVPLDDAPLTEQHETGGQNLGASEQTGSDNVTVEVNSVATNLPDARSTAPLMGCPSGFFFTPVRRAQTSIVLQQEAANVAAINHDSSGQEATPHTQSTVEQSTAPTGKTTEAGGSTATITPSEQITDKTETLCKALALTGAGLIAVGVYFEICNSTNSNALIGCLAGGYSALLLTVALIVAARWNDDQQGSSPGQSSQKSPLG